MSPVNNNEVFGILEKLEELTTLSKNCLAGSLVFESRSPFWGYYNETPHDYVPIYVYFVLEKAYSTIDIIHATTLVKEELGIAIDAAKTDITIHDKHYHAIRLRHIGSYDLIASIQEAYQNYGLKPLMGHVSWTKELGRLVLEKIFCLNPLFEGAYLDGCEENHAYFEIPKHITFSEFESLTLKVLNNWMGSKFDAAFGRLLKKDHVIDFIRIYSEKLAEEYIADIKELYESKMK